MPWEHIEGDVSLSSMMTRYSNIWVAIGYQRDGEIKNGVEVTLHKTPQTSLELLQVGIEVIV